MPVIQQFLAGRPEGPISMDEMADEVDLGASSVRNGDAPTSEAPPSAPVSEEILTRPAIRS